jgi:hypothetical protein
MEAKIDSERFKTCREIGAELVDHRAENGKIIPCVQKALIKIPIDKINVYCMGKVPMYPKEELQQLQRFKQSYRKQFDADPRNEDRLVFIRDRLRHNWERSQEMFETVKKVGWGDSAEVVDKIIAHLLYVGENVTVETRVRHSSQLSAPLGDLKVQSTWKMLPDGTKYLSTINFIPISKED